MTRPYLEHLQVDDLIGHAGGDPWEVDDSLRAGSPTQINFLAQAFHQAAGSATAAEETFQVAQQHFQQYNRENGEQPINNGAEVQRVKAGLRATKEQLGRIAADLESIAGALAEARTASEQIATLNGNLEGLDALIDYYLQLENEGYDSGTQITQCQRQAEDDTQIALENVTHIRSGYSKTLQQALTNLRVKDGYGPDAVVREYDAEGSLGEQTQNQIEAFKKIYGREPVSANDWRMAEALDPHTYDPRYQGLQSNIVVGKFKPVPGGGVYRQNMYIPAAEVQNFNLDPTGRRALPHMAGDNRGPSPTAPAESSRVSIYADLENGILVARQNPTMSTDGVDKAAGIPAVSARQSENGTLEILYNAVDPFEPAIAKPFASVSGHMVVGPGAGGDITAGGTITQYPSTEGYYYAPDGTPKQLFSREVTASQAGPLNLAREEIWVGTLPGSMTPNPSGAYLPPPFTELGGSEHPPVIVTAHPNTPPPAATIPSAAPPLPVPAPPPMP